MSAADAEKSASSKRQRLPPVRHHACAVPPNALMALTALAEPQSLFNAVLPKVLMAFGWSPKA